MSGQGLVRRIKGGLTVGALVAAAVAVAFATGFTASRTVLAAGGAWLSHGHTTTHVNAGTGRPDATVGEDLVDQVGDQEVVTSPHGTVVVDTREGTATPLDTTTMTPGAATDLPDGSGRRRLVVAGRLAYLIGDRVVQPADPVTLAHRGRAIEVGRVAGAVATAEGTLVVLDSEAGTVVEVVDGNEQLAVEVAQRPGRDHLALTAVAGRPVVVDTRAGTVQRFGPGVEPEAPRRVRDLAATPDVGNVAIADASADGSTLWLVRWADGMLIGVDLDTGNLRSAQLDRDGPGVRDPVVFQGIVYVPHVGSHDVTVVDGRSHPLRQIARREPDGRSDRLEVFVQSRRVWINDPTAARALVVEPDGRSSTIVDKGTGRGVDGEGGPGPSPLQPSLPAPGPGAPEPEQPTSHPPPPVDAVEVDVPRVVGLHRDEACRQIETAQLLCDERPVPAASGRTEEHEVVGQSPAGGRLPVLGTVVVEYYAPGRVPVPDLTGHRVGLGGDHQAGPACQAAAQAGFGCVPQAVAAAPNQPADQVIPGSQQPAGGTQSLPGAQVGFAYAPTTLVPDVAGMPEVQACAAITALNLRCDVQYLPLGESPGLVADQDPDAGAVVGADSPVQPSVVTVHVPQQRPTTMPNVAGMDQATACATLQAAQLGCSWEANPTNSIRNPGLADHQSIAAGTQVAPGTVVSVYHPAGPDATLVRYQARNPDAAGRLKLWSMAPTAGPGAGVYRYLQDGNDRWARNGNVGRCYSTQVEGSVPLYGFRQPTPDDPSPAHHFYATQGKFYDWGIQNYPENRGVACYVIPANGQPGAQPVVEWRRRTNDVDHHFFTASGERPPNGEYDRKDGHWMTW